MSRELPLFLIDAGELLQHVSRVVYRGSPLYYGRSGTNRYDDPARPTACSTWAATCPRR